ncbi:MAG: heavy-metal-associated domain-containing protein [Methylocystaceae bacterium]
MHKRVFIEGMKCGNCANHVKEALTGVAGVADVEVNLSEKYALIASNAEVKEENIKQAVNSEKYKVVRIESV